MKTDYCCICNEQDKSILENHHVVPKSLGGSDDESNLITVCNKCHGILHSMKNRSSSSNLTKIGLQKAKDRGVKLGTNNLNPEIARKACIKAVQVRKQIAKEYAHQHKDFILKLIKFGYSLRQIAKALEENNIQTPSNKNKKWTATAVKNMIAILTEKEFEGMIK